MNVWYWVLAICGLLLVLAILYALLTRLANTWLRRHPELIAPRSSNKVAIPPGYAVDMGKVQLLEARRERDPRLTTLLIQVYERILKRLQPNDAPTFYASIQHNLGRAYRDLQTGDRAINLTRAIACCQEALRFLTPETAPRDYAMTQFNLGSFYRELPTGDRTANLTRAIACYQEALRFLTPETESFHYARLQISLGQAYGELPTSDQAANLTQAIACYQEALHYLTPETESRDYAMTQLNLGQSYAGLPTGNRAANLTQAITCCQEALRFWTPEAEPYEYASLQLLLSGAYAGLPTGDRAANLTQAITCCQEALRFWTPEAEPLNYASLQINLGVCYKELPTGDRTANLTRAIACYQEALRFLTPETESFHYARLQNSLGNAYSELPTGNRAVDLAQAVAYYQEALRYLMPETAPFEFAAIQNNLGNAYRALPTGDRASNLTQAITCFQEALRFRTPETAPFYYAMTQYNLGSVYNDLPTGDRAANLAKAIMCCQEALRFWTPEIAPSECRRANRKLADVYFDEGKWNAALSSYRSALDAGERLYLAGLSAESKATEVAENAALYRHAAFSAARCGEVAEALLILERGKTRLLAEALRLRIPRPTNIPDEVWTAFEAAGATVRAVQSGETASQGKEHDLVQAYMAREQDVRAANAALEAAIERIRIHAPGFLRKIDLSSVQALLPDEQTVLIAFCITEQGSMGFVVNRYNQDIQVAEVPTFTQSDLRRLIVGVEADGRDVGDWLGNYIRYRSEPILATFDTWQNTITSTLVELGHSLLAPILSKLPAGIERIIFLPSAELFLLPLHAANLPGKDTEKVCDRYKVSYIPSIEVMINTRAKAVQVPMPDLYAVINPEDDPRLVFTPIEGTTIAKYFAQYTIDEGRTGTKQRVVARMQGRTYVHFSCHGEYDWIDPSESGLTLADSRLTLADLQRGAVDLSAARLVTLSACETGIIDILKGSAEEYVGIPAGFLLSGVPCVVSSLWVVPDLSTALLMECFYRNHLRSGMDFMTALHEAQLWVRELSIEEVAQYAEQSYQQSQQRDKTILFRQSRYYRHQAEQNPTQCPFAHPFYWAAFTVNGM